MRKLFVSEFKEHTNEVSAQLKVHRQEVQAQLEVQQTQLDEHSARIATIESRPAVPTQSPVATQYELDKLAALEKSLIAANQCNVLLTNFFDSNNQPMAEISRKPFIDKVLAAIKKKPVIAHQLQDGKLTQFTKVMFESKESAELMRAEWIKQAPKNGAGAPIFARPDIPIEVRKLRMPMVEAERKLKSHFKTVQQQHKIRIQWHLHTMKVDGEVVARRQVDGSVDWVHDQYRQTFAGDVDMARTSR